MIFVALFILIFLIILSLSFYDSYNINKIHNYYKAQNCKVYYEDKGNFKGICNSTIVLINNSFTVDLESQVILIKYNQIESTSVQIKPKTNIFQGKYSIFINLKNGNIKEVKFKNQNRLNNFKTYMH